MVDLPTIKLAFKIVADDHPWANRLRPDGVLRITRSMWKELSGGQPLPLALHTLELRTEDWTRED
jgi:hypothetical protein